MIRTHNCGELRADDVSREVILCGWIASRRDHGEIIFMDLRDKHGLTQMVFDPEENRDAHLKAHQLRNEYCVKIGGTVSMRPEGTVNPKIGTGEIEVEVKEIEILSESDTPPFEIKDDIEISEEVRLKYRYLDLRRDPMQKKLLVKHKVYRFLMDFLDDEGFIFVDTPMLTKSTPEGARDYLVPSRIQQGSFYALPQSPQIFKQLLMVAGLEKYFQIVRCFRDEDLRADRQPEFTQLDMEMSFAEQDDLLGVCERLFKGLFSEITGLEVKIPFSRMDYREVISRYGSDKPDTRFEVFLSDLTRDVEGSDFKVFREVIKTGGNIIALAAPGYGNISRKDIDDLTAFVAEYGARGLAYFKVEEKGLSSPIAKFFSPEMLDVIRETTGARTGDMIFVVADAWETACGALGALRLKIGKEKGLIDRKRFDFLWVVNFPLFKFNKDEDRWVSEHHPFTSFREEDMEFLDKGELGKIRSRSYDLVLNGSEIGSGSIRIHRRDIQRKIFDALGLTREECERKFGFLLEAFRYGPPPHGGIAFGIDRLITVFTKDSSIREVIPFPKTQKGVCPLTGAPSFVDDRQLRELGIKLRKG
ncbi:MAG: aspartate--tRNA ligase [Candidatus Omnitrophota bacterium]|nr:aspartate--tRNA ligase [Candidatus Omnitrophota bacterium]